MAMSKVVEVQTVYGDEAANKLLDEGWVLFTALNPIPSTESTSGASYVLIRHEAKTRKAHF
jgi:hypothetical protein